MIAESIQGGKLLAKNTAETGHNLNHSCLPIFDHCSHGFIWVLMLNMKLNYKTGTIKDI